MEFQGIVGIDFSLRCCEDDTFKALLKIKFLRGDVWPVANVFGNMFSVKLNPINLPANPERQLLLHTSGLVPNFPCSQRRCRGMNHRLAVPLSCFSPDGSEIEDLVWCFAHTEPWKQGYL